MLTGLFAASLIIGTLCFNYLASQRWQKLVAESKAAGEVQDFVASLPRVPEDSENFGAAGALRMVASVRPADAKTAEANRATLQAIGYDRDKLAPDLLPAPQPSNGVDLGIAWSPEDWAEEYRTTGCLQMPAPSGHSAKDIIAGFARNYEDMKPLIAAVSRPYAVLTPEWPERGYRAPVVMADQAHMTPFISLARILTEHAQAAVAAGEPQMAVDDIRVLLRLAELVASDHLAINALVSITMLKMVQEPVWSLLRSRTANDQQLESLMDSLSRADLRKILLDCYRGEILAAFDWQQWASTHPEEAAELGTKSLAATLAMHVPDPQTAGIITTLVVYAPRCFGQDAASEFVERNKNCCVLPLRDHGIHAHFKAMESQRLRYSDSSLPTRIWQFMNELQWKPIQGIALNAVSFQARRNQAIIACALERHWLKQQSYPERLEDLSPTIPGQSFIDPMADKPMRYQRTDHNRYVLWSVGLNEIDDGGKIILGKGEIAQYPGLSPSDNKGDWVWSYEPLVEDGR